MDIQERRMKSLCFKLSRFPSQFQVIRAWTSDIKNQKEHNSQRMSVLAHDIHIIVVYL